MDDVACYCTNLRRAALALTSLYDEALAPHRLKVTQFSLLRAVRRRGPVNLTALSGATGLDRSTLGRNLRLLAAQGLVTLSPGEDQRDRVIALTRRGLGRVAAASRTWDRVQGAITAGLGAESARLVEGTRRVVRLSTTGALAARVGP